MHSTVEKRVSPVVLTQSQKSTILDINHWFMKQSVMWQAYSQVWEKASQSEATEQLKVVASQRFLLRAPV